MKTLNSISGGQTSSYVASIYPADYNVFALVRTDDKNCKFKDEKLRLEIEDRLQKPFIGTLEDDLIIYTILDLEQFIGKKIDWVTGKTFDEVVKRKDKIYLPNKTQRICTVQMKIEPIFYYWAENIGTPVETRIGYRANETRRAKKMLKRTDENGLNVFKATFEKNKRGQNKWENVPYQKPIFPLIEDNIYKDKIVEYWKNKPVRFAPMNNCVGCFHKNPLLLNKMCSLHPNKLEWFAKQERESTNNATWRSDMNYDSIIKWNSQNGLFDVGIEEFNECDSGYCGL